MQPERNADEQNQHGNFDQRTDHGGESHARIDTEYGDGYGDSEFKIIAGGSKRQRCAFRIIRAGFFSQKGRAEKHQDEINNQRNGYTHHVKRNLNNELPFVAEHHDDRKKKRDQSYRADFRDKDPRVPIFAFCFYQNEARQHARKKRNAEINQNAFGDLPDTDIDFRAGNAEKRRQNRNENISVNAVKQHLKNAVEGDEPGDVFVVAFRQIVPDDDHRDAARDADHNQADHVFGFVGQKENRQKKHQKRSDYPVLNKRQSQNFRVPKNQWKLFVFHFGKRRIHHQDQTERDGNVRRADLKLIDKSGGLRQKITERDADSHRSENPQRQKPVEKR